MKRRILVALLAGMAFVAGAVPAGANVIPNPVRQGESALAQMYCFEGTVTFTIVGPGVSQVVGTGSAGADNWARLTFTMPNLPPGPYTMVASGTVRNSCKTPEEANNASRRVEVPFTILASDGGGGGNGGPSQLNPGFISTSPSSLAPRGQLTISAGPFSGIVQFSLMSTGQLLGSAPAGSDGVARITVEAPEAPGAHAVGASGTDANGRPLAVTTTFAVTPTTGAAPVVLTPTPAAGGNATPNGAPTAPAAPPQLLTAPPSGGQPIGVLAAIPATGTAPAPSNNGTAPGIAAAPLPGGGAILVPSAAGTNNATAPSVKVEVAGAQENAAPITTAGSSGGGLPLSGVQLAIGGAAIAGALVLLLAARRRDDQTAA